MANQKYLQVTLLNRQFRRIIHEASRNDFLIASMHTLEWQYDRLAYFCFSEQEIGDDLKEHFDKVTSDHGQLIAHLNRRDEQSAVDTITDHIRPFHSRVTRYLFPSMQAIHAAHGRLGRRP